MRSMLKKEGFKDISFVTIDRFKLTGLFLKRPNASYNVILCAGWLPGLKEGMASFYALLPENCNIFLFDARGHGKSEGHFLWKLWRYGLDEYKDIVAAIDWIHCNNNLPIFILGICSGAFNAARALAYLHKKKLIAHYDVRGLIFDSGWGSVSKIITTAPIAGIKKRLACVGALFLYSRKNFKKSYLYHLCSYIAHHLCTVSNYIIAHPLSMPYEKLTNLFTIIEKIATPILFIHSEDDVYAHIDDARKLSQLAKNKQCWWIEKSSHAKHHLIHTDLYTEKISAFIDPLLATQ
jgi:pimeloyl-ACP methyl ester carboxylesterase